MTDNDKRPDQYSDIFDESDLAKMFVESLEYGQDKHMRPHNFWIPLLGLFTGARLEEICQLRVSDIKEVDGVWCIDINEDHPEKSVKASEQRSIPLHPFLLELGFQRYARSLPDDGRVFPELRRVSGRWGHYPGTWFELFKSRCGIEAPKNAKVFHSFRHTVASRLKELDVPSDKISELLGHSAEGEYSPSGEKFNPRKLLDGCVSKLDFEKRIDLSHLKKCRFAKQE
jgi:integrase